MFGGCRDFYRGSEAAVVADDAADDEDGETRATTRATTRAQRAAEGPKEEEGVPTLRPRTAASRYGAVGRLDEQRTSEERGRREDDEEHEEEENA